MTALFLNPFSRAFSVLADYWWVYLPILLLLGVFELWSTYTRTQYFLSLKWVLLEIVPPPDVQKSPKIAENIFSGLHAIYRGGTKGKEMFFQGKVPDWFSLEIVSTQGDMRFYIRTLESLRNVVETHIFSQYPDAHISVADDYINALPEHLPNDEYDLFGGELIFTKDNAYPLKTYPEFEEPTGKDEFVRTDPLAPLAEIMSMAGPGEHLWLQLVIRPTGDSWAKEGQKIIDKMIGKEEKIERDALGKAIDVIDSLIPGGSAGAPEKKDKPEFSLQKLTPGQKFVLEKIEEKMSKLGFKAGYRFLYVAKKEVFNRARVTAVTGMFKQVYSNNLNSFKLNPKATTLAKGILHQIFPTDKGFFADAQLYERKASIYRKYRRRAFMEKYVILNTEELATLWHLPGINVKAPGTPRVQAKTSVPPQGLPTQ